MRISLIAVGRKLCEEGIGSTLVGATRLLEDDFARVQQRLARLRDNLLEATGE